MTSSTLADCRLFFRECRRRFHTTGAILPSSPALCKALVRFVGRGPSPGRILEVGPGTGAVTRRIVDAMGPGDRLVLVEINDQFVRHLGHCLQTDPVFQSVADRVEVVHQSVADLPSDQPYDLIISGLPLNNFTVSDAQGILDAFARLAREGAILSFFQYMAVRSARQFISGRQQRQRLRGIGKALAELLAEQEIHRDWIWPNIPPAWVHHVRMAGAGTRRRLGPASV